MDIEQFIKNEPEVTLTLTANDMRQVFMYLLSPPDCPGKNNNDLIEVLTILILSAGKQSPATLKELWDKWPGEETIEEILELLKASKG